MNLDHAAVSSDPHDPHAAFGAELEALRARTLAKVGQADADYLRNLVKIQRRLAMAGRGLLFAGIFPPAFVAGVAALGVAKILDNMEIGHNVMHGQYDWMQDPILNSRQFDWDTASPAEQWKHSHNYLHHTFTNILGKDRDIGYGILRMSEGQAWEPKYLGNPLYAALLAMLFQYGVGVHDAEIDQIQAGNKSFKQMLPVMKKIFTKTRKQTVKDYVLFPLLAGPFAPIVFAGNVGANLMRNLWTFSIIFCGHFPEEVRTFTEAECENESRGHWYYRQLLGSANIEGGKLFHILSGNLSHQIEHHLFPDVPAHRYAEMAVEVRAICEKHGLPYHSGSFAKQFSSVWKRIFKLSLPDTVSDALFPPRMPAHAL